MKNYTILILFLISLTGYSQIKFEEGYIINNNNKRIECLIKNSDWRYNPDEIYYKLSANSSPIRVTINDIKEFGISSNVKYEKFTVNIDISSKETNDLTLGRNPLLRKQTLFLKQLVEGKANLFIYQKPGMLRLFYNINNSNVEQLIYKRYKTDDGKIGINNRYKQQLLDSSNCKETTPSELNKLNYTKNDLQDFFMKYNSCINSEYIVYEESKNKTSIDFKFKPGINYSSMAIKEGFTAYGKEMDNHLSYKIGVELEVFLPGNRNKWSAFLEPSFNAYNEELPYGSGTSETNLKVKFNYFETNLGVKHYLFLNDNSKINLSIGLIYTSALNTEIIYDMPTRPINPTLEEINITPSFRLGVGYNINKLSFEAILALSRQITGHSELAGNYEIDWDSNMKSVSFTVGYKLF